MRQIYRKFSPSLAQELKQTSSLGSEQWASDLYSLLHHTTNLGSGIKGESFTSLVGMLEKLHEPAAGAALWALAAVADAPADDEARAAALCLAVAGVEQPAWLVR